MNINIDLDNKLNDYINEKKIDLDIPKKVEEIVTFLLNHEKIDVENVDVSINAVTSEEIRSINNEYRGIDRKTDVLSFPIFEKIELDKLKENSDKQKLKEIELGDILLCLEVIEGQAIEYNTGIVRELLYMITHGLCHLLGYDHIEENDKKQMRELEEKVLNEIGVYKIDG